MPWDCPRRSDRLRARPSPYREHEGPAYYRRRMADEALGQAQRLRSSRRWKRFRAWMMRREPLCRSCRAVGRVAAAVDLDHIVPLRRFSPDAMESACFDEANVQPLCRPCHARKGALEVAEDRRG